MAKCGEVCGFCTEEVQSPVLNLELFSSINSGDVKRVVNALDSGATLSIFSTPNGHMLRFFIHLHTI